ncbi:MAG TPA: RNA polymerase sigma factor [Candidatus Acidoferrales bacterium]|nr:RNA polymerase sigma factor [Candidatus Acidoferrales bacterium]
MARSPRFFQEIDPSIVRRSQRGEMEAFKELYLFYGAAVRRLAQSLLNDREEANDLLHDLFLRLYERITDYRFEAPFAAWLYRSAVNLCLDRLRSRGRRKRYFGILPATSVVGINDSDPRPAAEAQESEQERAVRAALMRVPGRYRVCLILREIEDCSYEEIAAILDVSVGTVRSRLSRGRKQLRKLILEQLG